MRSSLMTVAALSVAMTGPVAAQTDQALIEQFMANQSELVSMVDGLSTAQWNFKESADRWSIAEIVEHIIVAEKSTWEVLTQQLTEADLSDSDRQMAEGIGQQIASTLQDRSQSFSAPPDFEPTGRWAGGDEVMGMFAEVRGAMLTFLKDADFDLRTHVAPNPILQTDVDAHNWAVISVEHCARHMQQIRQVMEHADYPM